MGVMVLLPTAMRQFANNQDSIELEGSTVAEVIDRLIEEHPELKNHLMDDNGKVRNFVNVYLNEDNVRGDELANATCKDGDELGPK